jgi:hypothetical protein
MHSAWQIWACPLTSRFPRPHRFVLGERIEHHLYDLLEILIQARYTRQRQPLLDQANLTLEVLRFQMRLAKDLQCLRVKSYAFTGKAPCLARQARYLSRAGHLVRQTEVDHVGVLHYSVNSGRTIHSREQHRQASEPEIAKSAASTRRAKLGAATASGDPLPS